MSDAQIKLEKGRFVKVGEPSETRMMMRFVQALAALLILGGWVSGCGGSERSTLPTVAKAGSDESPSAEASRLSFEEAQLALTSCLEEQGIIANPNGLGGSWISAELSGEGEDGPIESRHAALVEPAYAACASDFEAVDQYMVPLEPGDPALLAEQESFGRCMEGLGFEIEVTPTGFNARPPADPGTQLYDEWEAAIVECEAVVPSG